MSKPHSNPTAIIAHILGRASMASFDDISVSDLTDEGHWPDWAVAAIAYRDINVAGGERGPVAYRFFSHEDELQQWYVDSYRRAVSQMGHIAREVTRYNWDWGPVFGDTRSIWVSPI